MRDTRPKLLSDGWRVASLDEAFMDAKALSYLTGMIEQGEYPNTHAVLIEHAGHLVYEAYFEGTDYQGTDDLVHVKFDASTLHDLRSISKSITALLLGLAIEGDYETALATPVLDFFPELKPRLDTTRSGITLHHALTMTAGLEWDQWTHPWGDPRNDEYTMYESEDPIGYALEKPVYADPGNLWVYSSGMTEVVGGIISHLSGLPLDKFAEQALFGPLDIPEYYWRRSPNWLPSANPSASWGLRFRPRDLAKVGSLILNQGRWNDRQVVPKAWIDLVTGRHVNLINALRGGIYGYGFQWYVGQTTSIPAHTVIAAAGRGGQRLRIFPDHHLVLTVTAGNYDGPYQDNAERMQGRVLHAHRAHG